MILAEASSVIMFNLLTFGWTATAVMMTFSSYQICYFIMDVNGLALFSSLPLFEYLECSEVNAFTVKIRKCAWSGKGTVSEEN